MELTRPFAENGDRQDFPVDRQGDGTMSLEQGFGPLYGKPPEEGGYFIDRMKTNQLWYLTTKGVIDNKTAIETLKSEYSSLLTSSVKLLTKNLEWTIGTGGDFENIEDAINEIYKYSKSSFTVTLKIKNRYTITKPVVFSQLPLTVNIVGENGRSDELIVDLNNTNWLQFGLAANLCNIHIHDITIKAISNNNSLIYMDVGASGSIYNVDLIGMSYNTIVANLATIVIHDLNIQNNYQGDKECFDLSVSNTNLQINANTKFLSNNTKKLVAIRSATNAKIGSVWWATGIDISGNYKVGLQVDGGGVIDNPNIAMTGNIITKFSQTPGQWTRSGYISTNR